MAVMAHIYPVHILIASLVGLINRRGRNLRAWLGRLGTCR